MLPNIYVLIACAFIPFIFGYIWFHPKLFGGETWYSLAKLSLEDRKEVSKVKLLFTLVLNFFIAFGVYLLCVHQFGVFALVGGDITQLQSGIGQEFMNAYGDAHLTFGHGFMHGFFQPIFLFVIPIIGYVTIFERKSFRYFLVYIGYWMISLGLMGGILCQWGTMSL